MEETSMDQSMSPLIILEESNVESIIPDVIIREERLRRGTGIVLNKEQILNEITNMFFSKYSIESDIAEKKIKMFINLLNTLNVVPPKTILPSDLIPIVKCNKVVVVHGDDNDKYGDLDPEYQKAFNFKTQNFETYISQIHKNTDYVSSTGLSYVVGKPFDRINGSLRGDDLESEEFTFTNASAIDFYRHFLLNGDKEELEKAKIDKFEQFRVIPSVEIDTSKRPDPPDDKPGCTAGLHYQTTPNVITLYNGDTIDVVGFATIGNNSYKSFDINEYIKSLNDLEVDTSVNIFFNDFAFDRNKRLIRELNGIVQEKKDNSIRVRLTHKKATIGGKEVDYIDIPINKPCNCFIYDKNYRGVKFHKSLIKTEQIYIKLFSSIEKTLSYIYPLTISEKLYHHSEKIQSIHDIQKLCNELNIDFHAIPSEMKADIENMIVSSKKEPERKLTKVSFDFPATHIDEFVKNFNKLPYENVYKHMKTYVDTTLNRFAYLKKQKDYGFLYILNLLKGKLIEKKDKFINTEAKLKQYLDKLKKDLRENAAQISKKELERKVISKRYYNFEDLINDNDKLVYFDKELDPTRYHLQNQLSKNLKGDQLKFALINLLQTQTNNADLKEIEKEAKCIMHGRRKVIDGEYCTLQQNDGSTTLFVRRIVDNTHMWIKVSRTPFPICTDTLQQSEEDTLSLDPYDIVCKKVHNLHLYYIQNKIIQTIDSLESTLAFFEGFDTIIENIDKDINNFKLLLGLPEHDMLRRPINVNINLLNNVDVDFSQYIGDSDLLDLDKVFANMDFDDEFHTLHNVPKKQNNDQVNNQKDNIDILLTFMDILDIDFGDNVKDYILKRVNDEYSKSDVLKRITQKEADLRQASSKLFERNKNNPNFIKDYNDTLKKKLSVFQNDEFKKYYGKVIIAIASMINIVMILEYPNVDIRRNVPRCIKSFSLIGYPLNKSDQSFTNYISCVITTLINPGDLKFEFFHQMSNSEISSMIQKEIDNIVDSDIQLSQLIEAKKNIIKVEKTHTRKELAHYMTLNESFKPSFEFENAKMNNVIKYLEHLHRKVKESGYQKKNAFNRAFISNYCCVSPLTKSVNYYDFFDVNKIKDSKPVYTDTTTFKPKTKHYIQKDDLFGEKETNVRYVSIDIKKASSSQEAMQNIKEFLDLNKQIGLDSNIINTNNNSSNSNNTEESLWTELDTLYDIVIEVMNKFIIDEGKENNGIIIMELKNAVISMKSLLEVKADVREERLKNTRNSTLNFLRFKMPAILSKIINKKDPEYKLSDDVLDRIKVIIPVNSSKLFLESDTFTNIGIVTYTIIKTLYNLFYVVLMNVTNKVDLPIKNAHELTFNLTNDKQKNMRTVASIVNHIIQELHKYIDFNNSYKDDIKMKVEELREIQKQQKIMTYSKDDDTRKLQLTLETMGLTVNLGQLLEQDIMAIDNKNQENAEYSIADFQGENADADEVEEDYFIHSE